MTKSKSVENALENAMFASRWLMAPFYAGLVLALVALLVVFIHDLVYQLPNILSLSETEVIIWTLTLIDLSLAGNLLLMVVFSGYENFVSKIDTADHPDRPEWMGKIDFSAMKLKLMGAIVAISAIHLLKAFISIETYEREQVILLVVIHMAFVVSGVLLAYMDSISAKVKPH
jgi:uncharacterized protein (TIGR00645 family)